MKLQLTILLTLALSLPLLAAPEAAERTLAKKEAERKAIMHSMLGIRDTLLFYTFNDQQAVLRLQIDNKSEKFPVTGTLYLFDPKTTKQGLAKWLNNQHSDGLFGDAPKPILTTKLPKEICLVTEHKLVDKEKKGPRGALFQEYQVKLSIKNYHLEKKFNLKAFTDHATVYIKQTEG